MLRQTNQNTANKTVRKQPVLWEKNFTLREAASAPGTTVRVSLKCMKSVGDILKDLGFNKNAAQETQIAFFRHLIAATGQSPIVEINPDRSHEEVLGEQLEFDFHRGSAEAANS